jgi:hypothetical protein
MLTVAEPGSADLSPPGARGNALPDPVEEEAVMAAETTANRMLEAYPGEFGFDREALARCIAACFECAQACTQCADACLGESEVRSQVKCIRLNLDCVDVCGAAGRVLGRQTAYDANISRAALEACVAVCRACGDECERHGAHGMAHCAVCAEACRRCERACLALLDAMN